MPDPIAGESLDDFLDRCIPQVVDEGRDPDQAVAICISMYDEKEEPLTKAFNIDRGQEVAYWKAFDRRRLSFQSEFERKVFRAVRKQLSQLEGATNVNELKNPLPDQPIQDVFVDIYTKVGDVFARNSYEGLKGERYPHTKALPVWIERMRKYALIDASRRIVEITETTRRAINAIVVAGLEQGLSLPQIKKIIMGTTDLGPLNGSLAQRSARIARTEIISASNAGSLEGALSTGLQFDKQWLATPDERTRADHAEADGQTVDKNAPFLVGGEQLGYAGDPRGSAGNVINCRCTQIYIFPEG